MKLSIFNALIIAVSMMFFYDHHPLGIFDIAGSVSNPTIPGFTCRGHGKDYDRFSGPLLRMYNNNSKDVLEHFYSFVFDYMDGGDDVTKLVLRKNLNFVHSFMQCKVGTHDFYNNYTKRSEWMRLKREIEKRFPGLPDYYPEVFLHDHNIPELPQKVKDYIRERDMLDIGAFQGDSMAVINKYTDRKVYGYEPNLENYNHIIENIKKWNLNSSKLFYQNIGLGEENIIKYSKSGGGCSIIDDNKGSSDGNDVKITTIDDEVKKYGIKIGFIKADTEGYSWKIIKGGLKSIFKARPVFSLHLYHNPEEYFNIAQTVREMGNYIIQYRHDGLWYCDMTETNLLAFPAEILYPQNYVA